MLISANGWKLKQDGEQGTGPTGQAEAHRKMRFFFARLFI